LARAHEPAQLAVNAEPRSRSRHVVTEPRRGSVRQA
jgi:hypothetical protein